jgi:hypothetical protein
MFVPDAPGVPKLTKAAPIGSLKGPIGLWLEATPMPPALLPK